MIVAGALRMVYGWTKTFPVSIGRPALRIWTHGVELIVLIPLVAVLGREWGANGAATAVLVARIAFAHRLDVSLPAHPAGAGHGEADPEALLP